MKDIRSKPFLIDAWKQLELRGAGAAAGVEQPLELEQPRELE
jgi:hypothetical protein